LTATLLQLRGGSQQPGTLVLGCWSQSFRLGGGGVYRDTCL